MEVEGISIFAFELRSESRCPDLVVEGHKDKCGLDLHHALSSDLSRECQEVTSICCGCAP